MISDSERAQRARGFLAQLRADPDARAAAELATDADMEPADAEAEQLGLELAGATE